MRTNQVQTTPETKLTYGDYKLLPDDGKRYEIIEGDLFVTPSPTLRHQRVAFRLARILGEHVSRRNLGEVLIAPLDVVLSEYTIVQPDLVFVSKERSDTMAEANIQGPPDLVVEVLSPTTQERDLTVKKNLYRKYGVDEYWAIDPQTRTIQIWRGGQVQTLRGGKVTLTESILAGLELDLDEVFSA